MIDTLPSVAVKRLGGPVHQFALHPKVKRGRSRILGMRDTLRMFGIAAAINAAFGFNNPGRFLSPSMGGIEMVRDNLETIEFVSNGSQEIDLPADAVYSHLVLRLSGTLDVAGGTGAGTIHPEGPYTLLRKVQIIVNGRTELDLDGQFWRALTEIWFSHPPRTTNVASLAAAASNPFEGFLIIPFVSPKSVVPWNTAFPANAVIKNGFSLRVEWGNLNSLADGEDGALSFSVSPTLEVMRAISREPNRIFQAQTQMLQKGQAISATGNHRVTLPQNVAIRALLLRTEGGSGDFASGVAQSGILTDFTLTSASGLKNYDQITDDLLREESRLFGDLAAADQFAGYHYVEFAENGKLRLALRTRDLNDPALTLNIGSVAAGNVRAETAFVNLINPVTGGPGVAPPQR